MTLTLKFNQQYELSRAEFEKWWAGETKNLVARDFTAAQIAIDRAMRQTNWSRVLLTHRTAGTNGDLKRTFEIEFKK